MYWTQWCRSSNLNLWAFRYDIIFSFIILRCEANPAIVQVDLLCTVWYSDYLPNNLNSDGRSALLYLQPACRQSLMGPLVATDILGHVPDVKSFRAATRCIKLWATRNGVYSNVYGFPGGVAWALMVARVCQLYPNASASTIVSKFFHTMVHWNWSWKNPITLNVIKRGPLSWNPQVGVFFTTVF